MAWFFRVAMGAAAQLVMFNIPGSTIAYSLGVGLLEMCILGEFYGFMLNPA